MPATSWRLRLQDIIDAIDAVERYTADQSLADCRADSRTVDAALYQPTIVGEAARHVPQHIQDAYPDVGWRRLRETRNLVSHVYFGIDLDRVWGMIRRRLPEVRRQLQAILEAEA